MSRSDDLTTDDEALPPRWSVSPVNEVTKMVHVFPTFELHDINDWSGLNCWCTPTTEVQPNGILIVSHKELPTN